MSAEGLLAAGWWSPSVVRRLDPKPDLRGATEQALTEGGDARIALSEGGLNQYGCKPHPDESIIALGSSTASVISEAGFQAATALHARLLANPGSADRELRRLRRSVLELSGAVDVAGTEAVLAASGTDLHLFATQIIASFGAEPLQTVMAEPNETGSGVPAALSAIHFSTVTCQGVRVQKGLPITERLLPPPLAVRLRREDGTLRCGREVDAEFESHAKSAIRSGGRCLLVLTDLSKTGLMAPSPACAVRLLDRFAGKLDVLVDACQFRLAPATVRAYLEHGFTVAITGSKFVTGPAFCGALLLPPATATCARTVVLRSLQRYSARGHWPDGWPSASALTSVPNVGLMLRWEAALSELARFRAVPEPIVESFLATWGAAVADRLSADPAFEALPVAPIDRTAIDSERRWDRLQTIFPFLALGRRVDGKRVALGRAETLLLHQRMQRGGSSELGLCHAPAAAARIQLGQPVPCGTKNGVQVSALRVCVSARWVVEAAAAPQGASWAIGQAMLALDKVALVAAGEIPV